MKRKMLNLAMVVVVAVGLCGTAAGDAFVLNPNTQVEVTYTIPALQQPTYCTLYTQASQICGSAKAFFQLDATGTQFAIILKNTSAQHPNASVADENRIRAFGFNSTPNITVQPSLGAGFSSFNYSAGGSRQTLQMEVVGVADNSNLQNTLNPGQYGTLFFHLPAALKCTTSSNCLTIDLTKVHLIGLGPNRELSFKPEGTVTRVGNIPEPTSLLLLGSGLLGAGSALRKKLGLNK